MIKAIINNKNTSLTFTFTSIKELEMHLVTCIDYDDKLELNIENNSIIVLAEGILMQECIIGIFSRFKHVKKDFLVTLTLKQ
jgi:hypothetical protein